MLANTWTNKFFKISVVQNNVQQPLLDLDRHVGSFSHASLGSWGVVDQLAQAAFLPDLGLTAMEVGTVSHWRGVPPW
jgi:hypothetical protein